MPVPDGEAKLTAEQVLEIRASSETQRVLAERYGVSKALVGRIKRRELWRHSHSAHAIGKRTRAKSQG